MLCKSFNLQRSLLFAAMLAVSLTLLSSTNTATAVVVDSTCVNLTWQSPEVSDLDGFNVLRATQTGGPYTKLNGALLASTSFADTTVDDLTTYYYVVTSRDVAGNESEPQIEFESEPVEIDLAADADGDCDSDGLPNGWETEYGLDPREPDDAGMDNDDDGLTNADEYQMGTDPTLGDTDGDGLGDAEDLFPTDPTETTDADNDGIGDTEDTDDDNDGVLDAFEDVNGNGQVDFDETDPFNPDTDGDGISDGDEDANLNGFVEAGETDPRLSDTDGDGVADNDEYGSGTDPLLFDTDGDGYADAVDADPLDEFVTGDSDGDGVVDALDDAPADAALYIIDNDVYEQNDDVQTISAASWFDAGDLAINARLSDNDVDFYGIDTTGAAAGSSLLVEIWAGGGDRIDVHLYRADTLEPLDSALFVRERRLDLQLAGVPTARVPGAVLTFPADLVEAGVAALIGIEPSFDGENGDNRFNGTQDYSIRVSVPANSDFETDTDGDGLSDGVEWYLHTDPTLVDTDFDGLNDGDEKILGTEPTVADTDGDGLLDGEDTSPLGFGENHAPTAVITYESPNEGVVVITAGESLALRATDSYDSDNDMLSFEWNFGDGNYDAGAYVDHVFSEPGTYPMTLSVDDGNGGTDTATLTVQVDAEPGTDTVTILWAYHFFGRLRVVATSSAAPDAELTVTVVETGESWKLKYSDGRGFYRKTIRYGNVSTLTVRVTSSLGGSAEMVVW